MLKTTPQAWLKDVQTISSVELQQIEADIKSGKLTESEAQPLLVQAGLRAMGKRFAAAWNRAQIVTPNTSPAPARSPKPRPSRC